MVKHTKKVSDKKTGLGITNLEKDYNKYSGIFNLDSVFDAGKGWGVTPKTRKIIVTLLLVLGITIEYFLSVEYFRLLSVSPEDVSTGDIRRWLLLVVSAVNVFLLVAVMIGSSFGGYEVPLISVIVAYNALRLYYLGSVVNDPQALEQYRGLTSLFLVGAILSVSYKGLNLIAYIFAEILVPMGIFNIPKV